MQLLHSHALGWGKKIKGGRTVRRNTIGRKPAVRFSHSHLRGSPEPPCALPPRAVVFPARTAGKRTLRPQEGFSAQTPPPLPSPSGLGDGDRHGMQRVTRGKTQSTGQQLPWRTRQVFAASGTRCPMTPGPAVEAMAVSSHLQSSPRPPLAIPMA